LRAAPSASAVAATRRAPRERRRTSIEFTVCFGSTVARRLVRCTPFGDRTPEHARTLRHERTRSFGPDTRVAAAPYETGTFHPPGDLMRFKASLLMLPLALMVPRHARAQVNGAEQTLRDFVKVMNAAERASLREFVDARFVNSGANAIPAEQRVARIARLHDIFGDVTVRNIEPPRASEVSALVQSDRTEAWRRLTVFFDDSTPAARIRG